MRTALRSRTAVILGLGVTVLSALAVAQQAPPEKKGHGHAMHAHLTHSCMMHGGPGCPMASEAPATEARPAKP